MNTIKRRNHFTFALLNGISLGIYGIIGSAGISKDVDTLCRGDAMQSRQSFGTAWIIDKAFNLVVLLLSPMLIGFGAFALFGQTLQGLLSNITTIFTNMLGYLDIEELFDGAVEVLEDIFSGSFLSLSLGVSSNVGASIVGAILLILIGIVVLACIPRCLYLSYWWYTQQNRLVVNAHRCNMELNDKAFDLAIWDFVTIIPSNIANLLGYLAFFAGFSASIALFKYDQAGRGVLIFLAAYILSALLIFIGSALHIPMFYIIKNINRYADSLAGGYSEFDSMGLSDDDNQDNIFVKLAESISNFGHAKPAETLSVQADVSLVNVPEITVAARQRDGGLPEDMHYGSISCVKGSNANCRFKLKDGETIVIGKDPKVANIIIASQFADVSRKHCSITYDRAKRVYKIVDYSSNGTRVNNRRIVPNTKIAIKAGDEISLAGGGNVFVVN